MKLFLVLILLPLQAQAILSRQEMIDTVQSLKSQVQQIEVFIFKNGLGELDSYLQGFEQIQTTALDEQHRRASQAMGQQFAPFERILRDFQKTIADALQTKVVRFGSSATRAVGAMVDVLNMKLESIEQATQTTQEFTSKWVGILHSLQEPLASQKEILYFKLHLFRVSSAEGAFLQHAPSFYIRVLKAMKAALELVNSSEDPHLQRAHLEEAKLYIQGLRKVETSYLEHLRDFSDSGDELVSYLEKQSDHDWSCSAVLK